MELNLGSSIGLSVAAAGGNQRYPPLVRELSTSASTFLPPVSPCSTTSGFPGCVRQPRVQYSTQPTLQATDRVPPCCSGSCAVGTGGVGCVLPLKTSTSIAAFAGATSTTNFVATTQPWLYTGYTGTGSQSSRNQAWADYDGVRIHNLATHAQAGRFSLTHIISSLVSSPPSYPHLYRVRCTSTMHEYSYRVRGYDARRHVRRASVCFPSPL